MVLGVRPLLVKSRFSVLETVFFEDSDILRGGDPG